MKWYLPNAVTALGLALGFAGIYLWPRPLGLALMALSLACDLCDGRLARWLGCETAGGAAFDWHVDVGLAHVAALLFLGLAVNAALVLWQSVAFARGVRTSGRAWIFASAMLAARGNSMGTVVKVAAVGVGLFVAYRLYQAFRWNVPFVSALSNPFVQISALQVPGRAPGTAAQVEISSHPATRTGRGHF